MGMGGWRSFSTGHQPKLTEDEQMSFLFSMMEDKRFQNDSLEMLLYFVSTSLTYSEHV